MSRYRLWGSVLLVPILGIALVSMGCGGNGKTAGTGGAGPKPSASGGESGKPKGTAETPLESKGWATIKGKVIFDGTPPSPTDLPLPKDPKNKDEDYCKKGDLR